MTQQLLLTQLYTYKYSSNNLAQVHEPFSQHMDIITDPVPRHRCARLHVDYTYSAFIRSGYYLVLSREDFVIDFAVGLSPCKLPFPACGVWRRSLVAISK